MNGNLKQLFMIVIQKIIKSVKNVFCHELCLLLRREIFLREHKVQQAECNIKQMGGFWCLFILTS
jgi:hypothetical protein